MQYSFPVQDPVSAAEMGLIPVEFDSESFRNPDEHMSKTSRDGKIVPSDVLSVCKTCTPSLTNAKSTSVGVLRIEPHSGHFVIGQGGTQENSRKNLLNLKGNTAT
jgi:hypothetical protein